MTEVRKESLSALIDGEASEIEVHRLVREFRSDESLSTTWAVYQRIRTTARRDADPLSIEHHHQLFERISAAVEAEEHHDSAPLATKDHAGSSQKVVFGSLALAASLVVAVFVGVQQPDQLETPVASAPSVSSPVVVSPSIIGTQPVSAQSVSTQSVSTQPFSTVAADFSVGGAPELIELDEEKQKRLRAYLQQHDRMARMNPDKQFVNYSGNNERAPTEK